MDSHQDQLDRIAAVTVHHCVPIWSPPWYCCTWCLRPRPITPSLDEDIQGRECPSNVHPRLGVGHIHIGIRPRNYASTITTPSPTPRQRPIKLGANGDGSSYYSLSPPATEHREIWRKRSCAKRALRALCPCLAMIVGQGQPHTPPIYHLPHQHPSARWCCRETSIHHPQASRGELRQALVLPTYRRLDTVSQGHQWHPITHPILCPLRQQPRW